MNMTTYQVLTQEVNTAIASMEFPQHPQGLYEPIAYTLSLGGKRIRPVFMLLAAQLFNEHIEDIMDAAVSLEIFHNYTLLHDDLMDNADFRRGKPTVHKRWNNNTAILSGDAMFILSCKKMYNAVNHRCPQAMKVFLKTVMEVIEGQQYDMNFESRTDVSQEEYFEMIRLKTGVLISCALKMGALLGGASLAEAELMYQYGAQIGLAFQVQDDYLDTFGDVNVFGKSIGGDILEGKKTFLLINAFRKATATQKLQMLDWLERTNCEPQDKINFFTNMYTELGIPDDCNLCMRNCYEKANELLSQLHVNEDAKSELQTYSNILSFRNI